MSKRDIKEARKILKPVLSAEKKMRKAKKALVVAKLALAHTLVEADVTSNATLSAWTEGVLNHDNEAVLAVYKSLKK